MFVDAVSEWTKEESLRNAQVLHVGCGTSDCSVLRGLVENPRQIHNVDFSEVAVEVGESRDEKFVSKMWCVQG